MGALCFRRSLLLSFSLLMALAAAAQQRELSTTTTSTTTVTVSNFSALEHFARAGGFTVGATRPTQRRWLRLALLPIPSSDLA